MNHRTTGPHTDLDVMQSMVNHPAGRRYTGTTPDGRHPAPTRDYHRPVHQVGHARLERDTAPGDFGPSAWIALHIMLALLVLSGIPLIAVTAWRLAALFGVHGAVGPAILIAIVGGICVSARRSRDVRG